MSEKYGFVYMMTNSRNTVIYTGVTSDLKERVYQHKLQLAGSFTTRYNVTKLVYFEMFGSVMDAIIREKRIKGGSRKNKLKLIESMNPTFRDLYTEISS